MHRTRGSAPLCGMLVPALVAILAYSPAKAASHLWTIRPASPATAPSVPPPPPPQTFSVLEVAKPAVVKDWTGPQFSPRDDRIALAVTPIGQSEPSIGVCNSDGSNLRMLAPGGRPLWFYDANRILFGRKRSRREGNDFFVYHLLEGKEHPIVGLRPEGRTVHNRFAEVSPDGRKLVWTTIWADGFHVLIG